MSEEKIRLTEEQARIISQTPTRECWACGYFAELLDRDEEGWFLLKSDLRDDDGLKEHFRQLTGIRS